MEIDRAPLAGGNKIYTLVPQPILDLIRYFRKLKIKHYKQKKIQEAKTAFYRNYFLKFKINLKDENNPQTSDLEYEMIIPAKAIYFAKVKLEQDIKEKIFIEVTGWEEVTDEEIEDHLKSKQRYLKARNG